ncbi:MAG: phosphomannomutase/phosphoglucomutase [Anaerolineae bacterium]|nr:phosphomannomutase/phosphoglucomutase [Anaerolineales bacterium]MCQ3973656.1 phosphomannomutase [Anaerolineae bacterium]
MPINPNIFREFSIRGIADSDLADDVVVAIGQATGAFFKQEGSEKIVVGRDARLSSPRISRGLVEGLLQAGLHVMDVGQAPTPAHNFATDFYGAGGGVMVTASHNPPEHNGLKLRNRDRTLYDHEIQEIYRLAVNRPEGFGKPFGSVEQVDILPVYLERLRAQAQQTFEVLKTSKVLKIVVDGGNGANGLIVAGLLRELGCQVSELYCEPDGRFPHRSPDPTASGALADLSAQVLAEGADLGLAYDGDGDRVVLVDDRGDIYLGDIILMLLARQAAQQGPFKVVHDVSTTKALADDIVAHGGQSYPVPVGYAFVHDKMREVGATLGGETAGHIFCLDDEFRFDDALLASVKLLNYISASNQSVSSLIDDLPRYHTSPNYRIFCPDHLKAQVIQSLINRLQVTHSVDTMDGAKIIFEHGWGLIRPSNTQPALTFRAEGESAAEMERIKTELSLLLKNELTKLGVENGRA